MRIMVNTYGIHVDDLVERGAVYKADTIEELAEQVGMDPGHSAENRR